MSLTQKIRKLEKFCATESIKFNAIEGLAKRLFSELAEASQPLSGWEAIFHLTSNKKEKIDKKIGVVMKKHHTILRSLYACERKLVKLKSEACKWCGKKREHRNVPYDAEIRKMNDPKGKYKYHNANSGALYEKNPLPNEGMCRACFDTAEAMLAEAEEDAWVKEEERRWLDAIQEREEGERYFY